MEDPKSKSMTTNNGKTVGASIAGEREAQPVSFAAIRRCDKTGILVLGAAQAGDYEVSTSMRGATSEDQRNCRSDGWQYGLVLQPLVCAFDYAMRRSSWMHVQGPSSAISHAPRTLQMSHVPNHDDL
jgi:hypothetical protein